MQALTRTVYLATVEPEPEWDAELNRWYAEEHIPNLLKAPGYRSADRYVAVEGTPKYMNFYQIDSVDNFHSPERDVAVNTPWSARVRPHFKSQLNLYEQIYPAEGVIQGASWNGGAAREGGLLVVRLDCAPEHEQDFNDWYDKEHLAALAGVPGVIATRRFRAIEGAPKYLALYQLTDPTIQNSEAWARAIDTPWSARARESFTTRWRTVYRPLE